ncbi:unnamed protein product [Anisakis simplex]|uniref:Sushi domain-containing protein n=1 Tax=Anisakis simplex TaxID=6269 RepID=A0A0M3J9J8_ANISI|nr:unnamed protein product [Anisakis simplex]
MGQETSRNIANATFFTYRGEQYALGKTAFVYQCKPGYVYAQGSAHLESKKQTIMCNGDTRRYEDVESRSTDPQPEQCVRPPNANECKVKQLLYKVCLLALKS